MSEYFIPNFKHKYTVYLKLKTPIYCIPREDKGALFCILQKPLQTLIHERTRTVYSKLLQVHSGLEQRENVYSVKTVENIAIQLILL